MMNDGTEKMTLRDEIASRALSGLLATNQDFHDDDLGVDGWKWHAKAAYCMADAMLLERKLGDCDD
jgi:hypothetical protein